MHDGRVTLALALLAVLLGACGGAQITPAPTDSLAAREALRAVIEDVAGSTAYAYDVADDRGHGMAGAKIIAIPETGEFAAIYHAWRDNPGIFEVHLATSSDLMTWTWHVKLASEAAQPTIRVAQDGGYVAAWEVMRITGDPNPMAFAYYPAWEALLEAKPTKTYETKISISPCCEGTPNLYSASSIAADVGLHFYDDYVRDRQARGTMTWTDWSVAKQPQLDATLTAIGVEGHIGDRDSIHFRGFDFLLLEGDVRPDDWSAWRIFLVDDAVGAATPLDIRTHARSLSMSNPTIELVELGGKPALVMGVFIQQSAPGSHEDAQLIYYRTLDGV
ncbi:MAG TPA: hypothetical protein VFY18_12430 [Candidatus Limnocylindrales bacterium]|nr:hypothetical protein [Candidatus Limnocylindrales bacterium]